MCERGGESHYGIVQEELKRKGKKKKEKKRSHKILIVNKNLSLIFLIEREKS